MSHLANRANSEIMEDTCITSCKCRSFLSFCFLFCQGKDKMCWWYFLKPGLVADFIDVKHSKLNKVSILQLCFIG